MKMKGTNRTNVAAYVAANGHLRDDLRGAKTLTQMATELGTTKSTVRRWLRRDHWDLWMEHWASAEEIWEAARQDREAMRIVKEVRLQALLTHLDRSLAELTSNLGGIA